jgi:hypothetical protein
MNPEVPDDMEMGTREEDVLYSLMAGQASVLRPRPSVVSCNCAGRLDELISLVRELRDEIRGAS